MGVLLDLGLPFPGFLDRVFIGEELERFSPGVEIDVAVVYLAEHNHQVRVRLVGNLPASLVVSPWRDGVARVASAEPNWADLSELVGVGDRRRATVLRVERWGSLLDLGLPFPGFIDGADVPEDQLQHFYPGLQIDVVVVYLAEDNHQVRVHLAEGFRPPASD